MLDWLELLLPMNFANKANRHGCRTVEDVSAAAAHLPARLFCCLLGSLLCCPLSIIIHLSLVAAERCMTGHTQHSKQALRQYLDSLFDVLHVQPGKLLSALLLIVR
jgi:hypothetical protein